MTGQLRIDRVADQPVRACYPYGERDLLVTLTSQASVPSELRRTVVELLSANPRCRRIVAAPAEDDAEAHELLEAAGFCRITEADLVGGTVVLFAAEPPAVANQPTSLDDMPH
ncbi:acetyltransferase (GNAT) family protein [Streptomyces sp. TLI_235]|nr:GNAT family N-acetyltransferase [Streptomyces sp. TLI_235]PBC77076.1 acetyltransferase (GNAT) family protein [Streptomyces sp. TLI_235]